jgi:hypothetical protein
MTKIERIFLISAVRVLLRAGNCIYNLQQSVYTLHNISKEYHFKISIQKTKFMALKGKFPIRTKIIIGNNILEQVSHFKYLGNE